MQAIVQTGGKQYRLQANDVVIVEKLDGAIGDKIQLDDVVMLADGKKVTMGTPMVDGAAVKAEIINQQKDDTIIVFKKNRRHNYRRRNGHRQEQTVLKVLEVVTSGATKAAPKAKAATAPKEAAKKTTSKTTKKSAE